MREEHIAMTSRSQQGSNAKALEAMATELSRVITSAVADHGNVSVRAVLQAVGIRVVNRVKVSIQKSGRASNPRTGKRAGPRDHVPSAPGQPPATDTGRLVQSYDYVVGQDALGMFVRVGSNVDYAIPLEIGTRHMAPRPALGPAVIAETALIAADVSLVIAAAQRAAVAAMPKQIDV
jgi:hypothetical protein